MKKPKRNPDGTVAKGSSLNPGGQPKWVPAVRLALEKSAVLGSALLESIVKGEPQKMTLEGEMVEVTPSIENRIKAVELVFRYTIPPPKAEIGVTTTAQRPAWLDELTSEMRLRIAKGEE